MFLQLSKIALWLLGISMIFFGLNKFFNFISVPPPEGGAALAFMTGMFSSYLAKVVAVIEIVGGLLLFNGRTSFLGFLLLAPVIANIMGYHFAHDFPGNGLWIIVSGLFFLAAWSFRDRFAAIVQE